MSETQKSETSEAQTTMFDYTEDDMSSMEHIEGEQESTGAGEKNLYDEQAGLSEVHQMILDMMEENGLDVRPIEFSQISTAKRSNDGRLYVSDMHEYVRYYIESGELELSDEYREAWKTAEEATQRKNDLDQMLNHPA